METIDIITIIGVGLVFIALIFNLGMGFGKVKDTYRRVGKVEESVVKINVNVETLLTKTKDWGRKIDWLWGKRVTTSFSPRTLNAIGKKALVDSGIKDIIITHYDEIFNKVQGMNPSNAYQAEECVIKAVKDLDQKPSLTTKLQDGAFKSGFDVDTILFVGAIYIRDKILDQLSFKVIDIDDHNP